MVKKSRYTTKICLRTKYFQNLSTIWSVNYKIGENLYSILILVKLLIKNKMDPNLEPWMTPKLAGSDSLFIPLNETINSLCTKFCILCLKFYASSTATSKYENWTSSNILSPSTLWGIVSRENMQTWLIQNVSHASDFYRSKKCQKKRKKSQWMNFRPQCYNLEWETCQNGNSDAAKIISVSYSECL